VVNINPAT